MATHRELEVGSQSGIFRERTHAARLPHRGEGCDLPVRERQSAGPGRRRWAMGASEASDRPLDMVPRLPQSTVPRWFTRFTSVTWPYARCLEFMIHREYRMEEYGDDWDDKPMDDSQNDMLMWLMSEAKGVERSLEGVARRLLLINFASIHATSLASHGIPSPRDATLTLVLYRLLANSEYIEPLREEVDAVIREEGWTKAGIDKMHKMDSFLRESQRLDSLTILGSMRLTLRPLTLSNGMTIPAGVLVAIPTSATHRDEITYPNPDEFDGFRFAKVKGMQREANIKRSQRPTNTCLLDWGGTHGRHPASGL
ncbi:cytochrome P450 [Russula emetica]|nr:cytochrome P450 [Russula emetica]